MKTAEQVARDRVKAAYRPAVERSVRLMTWMPTARQDELITRLLDDMSEPPPEPAPVDPHLQALRDAASRREFGE